MKVAQLGGVSIRLNNFFLVLLFFLTLLGRLTDTLVLFLIVLLHECSHAIVAVSLGQRVDEIELLPFGGVARLEENIETDPQVELWVAVAGPMTNIFLILTGYAMQQYDAFPMEFWDLYLRGNLMLAGFNLIPALPLDGGRVYRAHLAQKIGFRKATVKAARAGKAIAVVMALAGGAGLYFGYVSVSLLVLAFFVYFSASKELETAAYVFVRYLTRKKQELNDEGVVPAEQLVACFDRPVKDVVKHFVPKRFHVILVVDEKGDIKGMTTELDVITALFDSGIETPVGETIKVGNSTRHESGLESHED